MSCKNTFEHIRLEGHFPFVSILDKIARTHISIIRCMGTSSFTILEKPFISDSRKYALHVQSDG